MKRRVVDGAVVWLASAWYDDPASSWNSIRWPDVSNMSNPIHIERSVSSSSSVVSFLQTTAAVAIISRKSWYDWRDPINDDHHHGDLNVSNILTLLVMRSSNNQRVATRKTKQSNQIEKKMRLKCPSNWMVWVAFELVRSIVFNRKSYEESEERTGFR